MPTRAAAKKAAALLAQSTAETTLSFPPTTPPAVKQEAVEATAEVALTRTDTADAMSDIQIPTPASRSRKTEKSAPTRAKKAKKSAEPVVGGWDVKPHGMGKEGDLLDDTFIKSEDAENTKPPTPKKTRSSRSKKLANETPSHDSIKEEDSKSATQIDDILLSSEEVHDDEKPKKTRTPRKAKKNTEVLAEVIDKADSLAETSEKAPKVKKNKYGLITGNTPFPDHLAPTAEQCEEVNRILSRLHGEVRAPDVVPPPSATVTGCGEVPDVLDAMLRTLLSAATTSTNANTSMRGLKEKFGLRKTGKGAGSVSWEAVHEASLETVIDAIKRGGLAVMKGGYIKKILATIRKQNSDLLEQLIAERDTDKPVTFPGKTLITKAQKEAEIKTLNENMFSMDYVHNLDIPTAIDEMTRLPGIGVKTAACVVLFCMKKPCFAVDTHVVRHCKWLGWVPEKATRDQTFSHCEVRIPDHLKYSLHQLFIRHGKTCGHCRANTSAGSAEWDKTVCPIEHLVNRREAKKQPGYKLSRKDLSEVAKSKKSSKSPRKRKREEDSEEESEETSDPEEDDDDFAG
ncbi:GPD family base excision DNA repair protein [Rutstroemia sp. NJR-2017a BVV2]|nr:GPD family base excision DNA repair protein [Rutstroemia sp. NJR-2017a BVV2]